MKLTMIRQALAVLFALAVVQASIVRGEESPPQSKQSELIELLLASIPRLDPRDDTIQSFEITGRLPSPLAPTKPVRARVGWSRETGAVLLLSSADGGTPLVWGAENKALVCDFSSANLTVVNGVYPSVTFGIHEDRLEYLYTLHTTNVRHSIDLLSFPKAFDSRWSRSRKNGEVILTQTSPSGRAVLSLRFADATEPRFLGFSMRTKEENEVLCSIDSIQINAPLSPALSTFPTQLLMREGLPLHHLEVRKREDLPPLTKSLTQAMLVPPLILDGDIRKQAVHALAVQHVDWDEAEERYASLGPVLRKVLREIDESTAATRRKED